MTNHATATTQPCHSQFSTASIRYSLGGALDQFLELFAFRRVDLFILEHVQHEQTRRALEKAADEMAQGTTASLPLVDDGLVDEGAGHLVVRHIAFRFQDPENGLDGAIGDGAVLT